MASLLLQFQENLVMPDDILVSEQKVKYHIFWTRWRGYIPHLIQPLLIQGLPVLMFDPGGVLRSKVGSHASTL